MTVVYKRTHRKVMPVKKVRNGMGRIFVHFPRLSMITSMVRMKHMIYTTRHHSSAGSCMYRWELLRKRKMRQATKDSKTLNIPVVEAM